MSQGITKKRIYPYPLDFDVTLTLIDSALRKLAWPDRGNYIHVP
jgi:hypothetical protein